MARPQQAHLDAAHHILKYLQGTTDFGLLYKSALQLQVKGFTDADLCTCPDTRRSIGAYLFTIAGAPVSWTSKRQLTISRSSTESEYKSLSDRVKEGVWLSRLLHELRVLSSTNIPVTQTNSEIHKNLLPIEISCDSQSVVKLARNPVFHARSKHIKIHHHYVRERLLEGEISLKYINTSQQPADLLTKSLGRLKFELHRKTLNLYSLGYLALTYLMYVVAFFKIQNDLNCEPLYPQTLFSHSLQSLTIPTTLSRLTA